MRRVVITGRGVVSPIGTAVPAYFDGLAQARAGIDRIRAFDASGFPTRIAGEVNDLSLDAVALPEALRPALLRDRKSVFGIVAAREALAEAFGEDGPGSCYPDATRTAVLCATGLEVFHLEDLVPRLHGDRIDGAALLATAAASAPHAQLQIPADLGARVVAAEAGAAGLFAVNVSACAAGTQALGDAFRVVRDGVADVAIAGGYDSMVNPLGLGGFCMLRALSTSNELGGGACRPFDLHRDGFVLGEGAAMVVLEEYDRARQRGAALWAEVRGYGTTLDAFRLTDPDPTATGAASALRAALDDAKLGAADIDYINAHGTGTPKNDPTETAAIKAVFGAHAERLPVSSTKSQIGHLIGAAGAVEAVACLFALQRGMLPATLNLHTPDPECDLDYVPLRPRAAHPRHVICTSLGFGGQNAAVVLSAVQT